MSVIRLTLTLTEAAEAVGLSETTVYRLARAGEFPAIRVGRRWVVPVRALDRWLDEQASGRISA